MQNHRSDDQRIVITGIGVVSPVGTGIETMWHNLLEGVSGVSPIERFNADGYPTRIAAEIKDFEPEAFMDRKTARHASRYCQFASAAAQLAMDHAQLQPDDYDGEQVGVVIGSGVGGLDEIEAAHSALLAKGPRRLNPFTVPMMIADMAAGLVSLQTGFGGPNFATVSACASGSHALGEAAEVIRRGDALAMIAGGAEAAITPLTLAAFCAIQATSRRNDDPQRASRPFDRGRDGFVMAEGAAILVLERLDMAKGRGAQILAEIVGYGASSDAYHVTAPDPEGKGAARAMQMALRKAGAEPEEIQYINAHGTSTTLNDRTETRAIHEVFGEHASTLAVSSTKSMTGHLLGAAGALEAAVCALALERQVVPPTINLDEPDPECDLDYVAEGARPMRLDMVLSNSFGFGGHNACLALARVDHN